MLTYNSKRILKYCLKLSKNDFVCTNDILSAHPKLKSKMVYKEMCFLVSEGFLEKSEDIPSEYFLDAHITYKGENYAEFQRIDLWIFIRNSIIVPIVVSIITTLMTLVLKGEVSLQPMLEYLRLLI